MIGPRVVVLQVVPADMWDNWSGRNGSTLRSEPERCRIIAGVSSGVSNSAGREDLTDVIVWNGWSNIVERHPLLADVPVTDEDGPVRVVRLLTDGSWASEWAKEQGAVAAGLFEESARVQNEATRLAMVLQGLALNA